jgi:molybdopterin molybdotransferase
LVIPVEQLRRDAARYRLVDGYQPARGQFVHTRGSDCVTGTLLLEAGMRIGAPEAALLAANGLASIEVGRTPSIAIVSTGDELVAVESPLAEGQIRRSNDIAIATALRLHGFDRVVLEHIADDVAATQDTLGRLLGQYDVLVLSGGVSMGQRDYIPAALDALSVRRVFHRIAQRPGKPMWFGIGPRQQVVFALPGNPMSALVCAIRFVRPALLVAQGMTPAPMEYVRLEADADINAMLTCFVPAYVQTDSRGWNMAKPVPALTSGDFSALPHTHGIVQLPPGNGCAPAGAVVEFYRW